MVFWFFLPYMMGKSPRNGQFALHIPALSLVSTHLCGKGFLLVQLQQDLRKELMVILNLPLLLWNNQLLKTWH